jgi:CRP-like cAMP-binding protein
LLDLTRLSRRTSIPWARDKAREALRTPLTERELAEKIGVTLLHASSIIKGLQAAKEIARTNGRERPGRYAMKRTPITSR